MNKALITGSSKGIGLAIAKKLLQDSWTVVGCARTWPEPMEGTFIPYTLDLANLDTLPDHLTVLQKLHADLSLLICNVGKGLFGSVEEFSYTQMRSLIDLNFLSNAYFVKAFIPLFKQRRHGHVIFIGSESALQGKRMGSLYSASKFALRGFAQALHEECASSHIRVTTIHPGMVQTPFFDSLSFRPGNHDSEHLEAEDVASLVMYILHARDGMVFEEISLSPQKHRILKQ